MLLVIYYAQNYAQNYAGMIGWSLTKRLYQELTTLLTLDCMNDLQG